MPKVIVLMLSYNGKPLLEEALNSYLANDYEYYRVIVIDNGSNDGTQVYVEQNFPEVEVLRLDKNRAYSGGFNAGLDLAFNVYEADYVLITNNDVKSDTHLVSATVEKARQHQDAAFVTGKVYFYDAPDVFQSVGKNADDKFLVGGHIGQKEKDEGQYDFDREISWCDDIFWLVSRQVYNTVGGYDEEFKFQGEDFDWQIRAKDAGFKTYYAHKAKLWHKDSITIGKISPFKSYFDYRNLLIVRMKHCKYEDYISYLKVKRADLFRLTMRGLLKGKLHLVYRSWAGFISAIKWGIQNRKLEFNSIFK